MKYKKYIYSTKGGKKKQKNKKLDTQFLKNNTHMTKK